MANVRVSCDFVVKVPGTRTTEKAAEILADQLRAEEVYEQCDYGTPEFDLPADFVLGEDGILLRNRRGRG